MVRVHGSIEVHRVTRGAIGRRTRIAVRMAIQASGRQVGPCQCKGGRVVVKHIISVSGRVAGQAGAALISISRHAVVLVIRLWIGMTGRAGENCIVARIRVAVHALTPLPLVGPAVDGEILPVVFEIGRNPDTLAMANGTVCRKLCCLVVRAHGVFILTAVAGKTGVGGCRIIAVVAGCAVVGNGSMRPVQYIEIVVHREFRRHPARCRAVAHRAVIGQIQGHVSGIYTLVVVRLVATGTGVGRAGVIAPHMTSCAVVGDGDVCPGEGIEGVVIKGRGRPDRLPVAGLTIRRKLVSGMVRTRRRIVVSSVATHASGGRIDIIAVVAGRTVVGDGSMCSV